MNPREFCINLADYGLPTQEELVAYRIWDNHFHGFLAKNPIEQYERNSFFVERMGIERSGESPFFSSSQLGIIRAMPRFSDN